MLIHAQRKYDINFEHSFFIGDRWRDIDAGKKIGWNNLNEKDSTENLKAFKKIFNNLKNDAINGKNFEIKDNTLLDARKPLNKSLFNKLRKKHKV